MPLQSTDSDFWNGRWAPDDQYLAYALDQVLSNDQAAGLEESPSIYLYSSTQNDFVRVTPWNTQETSLTWSPDGQWIHLGQEPGWIAQVGAFGGGTKHPSGAPVSICYVAVTAPAAGAALRTPLEWLETGATASLPERQRLMVEGALAAVRLRMDTAPVPFRLLPSLFTLTELQAIYDLLLGRRLHKASFRRALHASLLVEPTDEWRSEGRGRLAQLFRYAPRKRRGHRRAVRFDLL